MEVGPFEGLSSVGQVHGDLVREGDLRRDANQCSSPNVVAGARARLGGEKGHEPSANFSGGT